MNEAVEVAARLMHRERQGQCPVCGKVIKPRDRNTGAPLDIPSGCGKLSRVECSQCHSILEQISRGEWVMVAV